MRFAAQTYEKHADAHAHNGSARAADHEQHLHRQIGSRLCSVSGRSGRAGSSSIALTTLGKDVQAA